jgi:hypothetical protein
MLILAILTIVSGIVAIGSHRFEVYCTEDNPNVKLCNDCPRLATCSASDFTCPNGTVKNKVQCLETNLNEKVLCDLHQKVKTAFDEEKIDHHDHLKSFNWSGDYSEKDMEAAVLYDDELLFKDNGEIWIKPQPLDGTTCWLMCDLFAICLMASIEAYFYRRYCMY